MKYISGCFTDIGNKKSTNEDSMLLMHASIDRQDAVFAVVCDGMGGLKKGEVASAEVVQACSQWFSNEFPKAVSGSVLDAAQISQQWQELMVEQDRRIAQYGMQKGFELGTTMVCILLFGRHYYIANIGDSRAYLLSDQIYQITHDHTVVQRKLDLGEITYEQSLTDPQRSVLLQCIGASDYVKPDFFAGEVQPNQSFLLCCDGFRHVIDPAEIFRMLRPQMLTNEKFIEKQLQSMTELIKARGETDNISALVIRTM